MAILASGAKAVSRSIMYTESELKTFLAGQRLMLGFDGMEFNEDLRHLIEDIRAGGIILFKNNIDSPSQVERLIQDCQECASKCGLPPLFVAVDQEGGTVARLKRPFTQFDGNPFIKTREQAVEFAEITARELKQAGFNMNLAPVLDWMPDGVNSIMKNRVFKGDVHQVSALGMQVIDTLQEKGIMAVAKHFPGIGRTVKDSHLHLPVLDIDLDTLMQTDIIPFKEAVSHDVAGVMLSHISYSQLDDRWQASLSVNIAGDLLRSNLGYQGLVMTDDLDMKAIQMDIKTCVQRILKADIDLALICHKGPNTDIAWQEISRLLAMDEQLYQKGKVCLARILKLKNKYINQ